MVAAVRGLQMTAVRDEDVRMQTAEVKEEGGEDARQASMGKNWCVRRSRGQSRLANVDALPVFDSQQDCGGARLRHGASREPWRVGVLSKQAGSERHCSCVRVRRWWLW